MGPKARSAGGMVRSDASDGAAGSLIRSRRRDRAITQQDLADSVGVSRQTVISMETGDYAPSVYLALKVARALESTVEELWG
jgi:putative transcriptional regulator